MNNSSIPKRHAPAFQSEIPSASADSNPNSFRRNIHSNSNSNHKKHQSLHSSSSFTTQYLTRFIDPSQMDVQSALDQIKSLVVIPVGRFGGQVNKPFKLAYYRKQTKNHWARDDPAFVVMILCALALMSLVYTLALSGNRRGMFGTVFLRCFLHGVLHFLFLGGIMATLTRTIAHQPWMRMSSSHTSGTATASTSATNTNVEWMYAFDIHCNAFVPFFMILYVGQFLLLPIVLGKGFLSFLMSNLLYLSGFISYIYITHLGYRGEWRQRR